MSEEETPLTEDELAKIAALRKEVILWCKEHWMGMTRGAHWNWSVAMRYNYLLSRGGSAEPDVWMRMAVKASQIGDGRHLLQEMVSKTLRKMIEIGPHDFWEKQNGASRPLWSTSSRGSKLVKTVLNQSGVYVPEALPDTITVPDHSSITNIKINELVLGVKR